MDTFSPKGYLLFFLKKCMSIVEPGLLIPVFTMLGELLINSVHINIVFVL